MADAAFISSTAQASTYSPRDVKVWGSDRLVLVAER